jgi:hypothetical protein
VACSAVACSAGAVFRASAGAVFPASDVTLRALNILGAAEKNDVVTGTAANRAAAAGDPVDALASALLRHAEPVGRIDGHEPGAPGNNGAQLQRRSGPN